MKEKNKRNEMKKQRKHFKRHKKSDEWNAYWTKKLCFKLSLLIPNLQERRVGGNTSYYDEMQHKE